jgi:ribosomal protein L37AE/L43A
MPVATKTKKQHSWSDFYAFFDVSLAHRGAQLKGDCPFCSKEGHFFASPKTGLWDCKVCGASGNANHFMGLFHATCLESTTTSHLKTLAKRIPGVNVAALQRARVVFDVLSESYWIPYYFSPSDKPGSFSSRDVEGTWGIHKGKLYLSNIGKIVHTEKNGKMKNRTYRVPNVNDEIPGVPLIIPSLDPDSNSVMVMEGESDPLALLTLFDKTVGISSTPTIWSLCGSNSFNPKWKDHFNNLDVVLCLDNDDAGTSGTTKCGDILRNANTNSLDYLRWSEDDPSGCDFRDMCISKTFKDPSDIESRLTPINEFEGMLAKSSDDSDSSSSSTLKKDDLSKLIHHSSYDDMLGGLKERLVFKARAERAIPITLATALSTYFKGLPIWLFKVAPASSGKTTIIDGFGRENQYAHSESKFGAKTLISGWRGSDGEDCSLLKRIQHRILCVKDFTPVLDMGSSEQKDLFGTLRDVYDGHTRVSFGNGIIRDYPDTHFTTIAGVTDEIKVLNHSSVGERFLKINYVDPTESHFDQTIAAIRGAHKADIQPFVMNHILGFFEQLANTHFPIRGGDRLRELVDPGHDTAVRLGLLAEVTAMLRTQVKRDKGSAIIYRPKTEFSARLGVQFNKLAQTLQLVLGRKEIDDVILSYVGQVACDSASEYPFEIARYLYGTMVGRKKTDGSVRSTICQEIDLEMTTAHRILVDMKELKIIERVKVSNGSGRGGRKSDKWRLTDAFFHQWQDAFEGLEILP